MGVGVNLIGAERMHGQADMKRWFMNVVVRCALSIHVLLNHPSSCSDKISLDRSIPDRRSEACKRIAYDHRRLPLASVVIIFTGG